MGLGGVVIAALPPVIRLKVPFSDGLGGGIALNLIHPTYLFTIRPDAFSKASGGFVVPYAEIT